MSPQRKALKPLFQKILFAAERFGLHELANHAAAGAYSFLLSATPAVLLVLALSTALVGRSPAALASVQALTMDALGPLVSPEAVASFFASRLGAAAIAVGGLSLLWAARLFVVTVQRGLRLIWSAEGRNTIVRDNALTFGVELLFLVAAVIILALSQGLRIILETLPQDRLGPLGGHLGSLGRLGPILSLWLFVFFTWLVIPPARPRPRTILWVSLACLALYLGFAALLDLFINAARYDFLYGVFGQVIIVLLKVYAFFTLYFYGAEYVYVVDHFDALLFTRFYRVSRTPMASRMEKGLFMEPERLLASYARAYPAGTPVFSMGDPGSSIYYIYDGEFGVYLGQGDREVRVGTLGPGEFFGEMAHILEEARTATVKAETDAVLFELPPAVYDLFLRSDGEALRNLADTLASRLKEADLRLTRNNLEAPGEVPGRPRG